MEKHTGWKSLPLPLVVLIYILETPLQIHPSISWRMIPLLIFFQQVALETTGGFYSNITTEELIRTNRVLFKMIPTGCFWYNWWVTRQFKSNRVIKKTGSGVGWENNHWVINQNQWCLIPDYTTRLFLVPWVDFTQFKSNPALWIKQPVVF